MELIGLLLAFAAGLLILYVLALLLVVPLKWLGKLFINSLIGFVVLAILNLIGSTLFGFTIALNPLNALIAGAFGVPGIILLILLRLFL